MKNLLLNTATLLWLIQTSPLATADTYQDAAMVLNLIGADITDPNIRVSSEKKCAGACHFHGSSIPKSTINRWANTTLQLDKCLDQFEFTSSGLECMKTFGLYDENKLGLARAGIGTKRFNDLFQKVYPTTSKYQIEYFSAVQRMQMPPFQNNPSAGNSILFQPPYFGQDQFLKRYHLPFNNFEYQLVEDWVTGTGRFQGAGPISHLDKLMKTRQTNGGMAERCTPEISQDAINHVKQMNDFGWSRRLLIDESIEMFGCEDIPSVEDSLTDPDFNYNTWAKNCLNSFPNSKDLSFARLWNANIEINGQTIEPTLKYMETLKYTSTFWSRTSSDGRFFGSSVNFRKVETDLPDKYSSYVLDFAKKDPQGNTKQIAINADYDPGFFPDNKAFTWHLGIEAMICDQSILEDTPDNIIMPSIDIKTHPKCFKGSGINTYQYPAASLNQNLGTNDYWLLVGDFTSDDAGHAINNTVSHPADPDPKFFSKENSKIELYNIFRRQQAEASAPPFSINDEIKIKTPYEGDFTVSPSGQMFSSRFARKNGNTFKQLGYRLSKIDHSALIDDPTGNNNTDKRTVIAEICLKGSKFSFSLNERFVITQHIVDDTDFDRVELGYAGQNESAPSRAPHKTFANYQNLIHNSANIYMVDILTGKSYRLTDMGEGQFAVYPHFRADGWIYFTVRDFKADKEFVMATNAAILIQELQPTESF